MKDVKNDPIVIGSNKILLIGIGNSGRSDDGLGWKFVDEIEHKGYDFLDCEFRYQLQVEDAILISNYDFVVFIDATHDKIPNGFELKSCEAADFYFFTSHVQIPGAILYLANHLYNKFPKAYTLAISGKDWELDTSLSEEAEKNLRSAISFFTQEFLQTIEPMVCSV